MQTNDCNPVIEDKRIHQTLKSYKGSSNIFFCPVCGTKFRVAPEEE
jgi:hypothetical protein